MSGLRIDVGGAAPYAITIGTGLLADGAALAAHLRGRHALVVSDSHVAPLYAETVCNALRGARPDARIECFVLPAGEASKTLAGFGDAIDALAAMGASRDACVFALGGGVVGDLAGFAAACWMRGIDCVQLPTSLLAMVDSSVGGKTAVDLPAGKNLVGAFHPPRAVFADTATLRSLPDRELRAGLAEVLKYGAIVDADFLDWLAGHAGALLGREDAALAEAIARSCAHKAAIVERDPFEHGERALLNFGHTFGHAIEAEQGFEGLNHGEAVAVGMVLAARLSVRLGLAADADAEALCGLLERHGLPTALPRGLDPEALLARMRLDKKALAGGLRFVLWDGRARPGGRRLARPTFWPCCAAGWGPASRVESRPMRLLLQQRPDGRSSALRAAHAAAGLLGGWTLVREAGTSAAQQRPPRAVPRPGLRRRRSGTGARPAATARLPADVRAGRRGPARLTRHLPRHTPPNQDQSIAPEPPQRPFPPCPAPRARGLHAGLADAPGGRYLPSTARRGPGPAASCDGQEPGFRREVTLQPLERFELDAAILFSDILTIPDAMDWACTSSTARARSSSARCDSASIAKLGGRTWKPSCAT